jgi:flagellin
MSRINTNISSVIAQSNLQKTSKELNLRLERLSTGLRINRGADDPAGLIISERLRSDIQGVSTAVKNSDRASSVIATGEAALAEVGDLLNSIKSLIVESANTGATSADERAANQLQIDSAIESITRISNTATFGGLKLLNGTLDYRTSGISGSAITTARIRNASFVGNASYQVDVDVVTSAQRGEVYYRDQTVNPGRMVSAITLEISGTRGVETISLPQSATIQSVVDAVNRVTILTGVTAENYTASSVNGIKFLSENYGSDNFVSVRRLQKPQDPASDFWSGQVFKWDQSHQNAATNTWVGMLQGERDEGRDVAALINGSLATGRGLKLSTNTASLGLDLQLTSALAIRPNASTSTFYVTGGGALFQLGQDVTALQQANFGIQSIAATGLGGTLANNQVQYLNSLKDGQVNSIAESVRRGDFSVASDILDTAIDEISLLRGRLGAFEKNVLQTNSRSLQTAFENLSASQSQIRDADFAAETSKLTRAQILSSAGTSVLSLANQQSQQVLSLLQG